jgi:hypothetical protein
MTSNYAGMKLMGSSKVRQWTKVESHEYRIVKFALEQAIVKLVSYLDYRSGRVYKVEDIITSYTSFVGEERLELISV